MDCLILAGGKCSEEMRQATGCELRAQLPIKGEPIARLVAETAAEVVEGRRILVGFELEGFTNVPAGKTFIESMSNGLNEVKSDNFLLCAADLPFLTPEAIQSLIADADLNAAINYPIVPISLAHEKFPGMRRTTLKIREGQFTGGNLGVLNAELMRRILPVLEKAYLNRKKPLKLAMQIGLGTLGAVAVGQVVPYCLPLASLERNVQRFLGAPVKAIISNYPEVGADIDNLEQYLEAVKLLESNQVS